LNVYKFTRGGQLSILDRSDPNINSVTINRILSCTTSQSIDSWEQSIYAWFTINRYSTDSYSNTWI